MSIKVVIAMTDSIHIRLSREQLTQQQIERLYNITQHIKAIEATGERVVHIRSFKNFQVVITHKSVVVYGSLTKYVLGHNIFTIDYKQTKAALYQLRRELGIPILKGELARIDMGECFFLNCDNPVHIFRALLPTPNYRRSIGEKEIYGVQYQQGHIKLTFYNKTFDAIKTPEVTLQEGQHVIRIEARIMKNVRRTLLNKSRKLGVVHLLSPSFHKRLAMFWYKHYCAIHKKRKMVKYPPMEGYREYSNYLIAIAIQHQDLMACHSELDIIAQQNNWNTRTLTTVTNKLLAHSNNGITTQSSPYIKENDVAVSRGYIAKLAGSNPRTIYNAPLSDF